MISHVAVATLASISTLQAVQAYFILQGSSVAVERIDPIVSPGKIASHVHNIVGVGPSFPVIRVLQLIDESRRPTTSILRRPTRASAKARALHFQSRKICRHTGNRSSITTTQPTKAIVLFLRTPRSTTCKEVVQRQAI